MGRKVNISITSNDSLLSQHVMYPISVWMVEKQLDCVDLGVGCSEMQRGALQLVGDIR